MKYFLSIQVIRPGAKLGPLSRCLIVEGNDLGEALDAMTLRLIDLGLHFRRLTYASHCSGKEMDKVVLPIWRGLQNDIHDLKSVRNNITDNEVTSLGYTKDEVVGLLAMAVSIEEAIRDNSDNHL